MGVTTRDCGFANGIMTDLNSTLQDFSQNAETFFINWGNTARGELNEYMEQFRLDYLHSLTNEKLARKIRE